MMVQTRVGVPMDAKIFDNYLSVLINSFFKILPIWENQEPSLSTYMESLQIELLGCNSLITTINSDPMFIVLLSILQYLIDTPSCNTKTVKREVFKAISICNKLKDKYSHEHTGG